MAMPISKHRSIPQEDTEKTSKRYEVMVTHGKLETSVFIQTDKGVNMLRLKPIPGKPGHYEGNVYVVHDNTPEELAPRAKVRAHFEQNYDTLQLTYRSLAQAGIPPSEVKLVGQAVSKNGKSMYNMLLLP